MSPSLNRILQPEEKKILELKYAANTFGKMDPGELQTAADEIILRIHVITGWTIPAKELLLILRDEFLQKITESYLNLNAKEIFYAFRNKPAEIKEWGKAMNISLIDEVLQPYLEKRFEISKIEEQKKQIEYKPDIEQIEKEYQEFLKTDLGKKLNPKI